MKLEITNLAKQPLTALPVYVTEIHLKNLSSLSDEELMQTLSAIPAWIRSLNLMHNDLSSREAANLAQILAVIPASVTVLNIGSNGFNINYSVTEFKQLFKGIPKTITMLGLNHSNLYFIPVENLVKIFQALPPSINALILVDCFRYGAINDLAQILASLPRSVRFLSLGRNMLEDRTAEGLARIFSQIPASILSLDLRGNHFGFNKSDKELANAFKAIPATIKMLNLSDNCLGGYKSKDLEQALAMLTSVTSLCLKANDLVSMRSKKIIKILETLPVSIASLDLRNINLNKKKWKLLVAIFRAIPNSVTTLDLSNNYLGRKSTEKVIQILQAIPTHIKHVSLKNNELFANKSNIDKNKILEALGEDRLRFDLSDNGESDLARALGPMAQLAETGELPKELIANILSYLPPDGFKKVSSPLFFDRQLERTQQKQKELQNRRFTIS